MADISKGKTFDSNEEVTNTKLHDLVDNATVTNIQSTDLSTGCVVEAKLGTGAVTNTKLGADCVDGDKIGDDVIDSEHYVAGSIDTEHIGDSQVTNAKLAGSIEDTKLNKITTASKVGGDALTDLANIPSGAGAVPAANLTNIVGIKAWVKFSDGGAGAGAITPDDSFNITSVTKNSTGNYTIAWDTDFANANYAVSITFKYSSTPIVPVVTAQATGTLTFGGGILPNGAAADPDAIYVIAAGDQ